MHAGAPPKHRVIDSSYYRHWRLRGLQTLLYQMQNPYHGMFQLAGDRLLSSVLCHLLNPQLNASAITSLLWRQLMLIGFLALE